MTYGCAHHVPLIVLKLFVESVPVPSMIQLAIQKAQQSELTFGQVLRGNIIPWFFVIFSLVTKRTTSWAMMTKIEQSVVMVPSGEQQLTFFDSGSSLESSATYAECPACPTNILSNCFMLDSSSMTNFMSSDEVDPPDVAGDESGCHTCNDCSEIDPRQKLLPIELASNRSNIILSIWYINKRRQELKMIQVYKIECSLTF